MTEIPTQATQRDELAAAVHGTTAVVDTDTVTVTGHPTQPAVPSAYDAWPVWVATRPVAMCAAETDWTVLVALPGSDPQTWAATGDELTEAVAEALSAHGVTRIEPVTILMAEGQSMPGLSYTLTY